MKASLQQKLHVIDAAKEDIYVIDYPFGSAFSNDYVLRRAMERKDMQEQFPAMGSYNVISSNCEHFAKWAKTGSSSSVQARSLIAVMRKWVLVRIAVVVDALLLIYVARYDSVNQNRGETVMILTVYVLFSLSACLARVRGVLKRHDQFCYCLGTCNRVNSWPNCCTVSNYPTDCEL